MRDLAIEKRTISKTNAMREMIVAKVVMQVVNRDLENCRQCEMQPDMNDIAAKPAAMGCMTRA